MVDNIGTKIQKREDRFRISRNLVVAMVVHIHLLVLVKLYGIDEAVLETFSTEVEVLVVEGISPSLKDFGTGLYHNADRMVEIPIPTRDVVRSFLLEDEPEEVCYLAPTGKPEVVSVVTSGVYVHPLLLRGMVVIPVQVCEPMD